MSDAVARKVAEAYQERDWSKVRDAYFMLTGKWLPNATPTIPPPNTDWQSGDPPPQINGQVYPTPTPVVDVAPASVPVTAAAQGEFQMRPPDPKENRTVRANGTNLFNPAEYGDVADEDPNKTINDQVKPIPRTRPPVTEKPTVECSDCKKTIQLSPIEAERIFAPGSLYRETGKYECALLKCGQSCPNKT